MAMSPVATPLPIARRLKWLSSPSSRVRRASTTRNTAARNAAHATASTPTRIDVGPNHGPPGTLPEATAPKLAPRKNGVRIDDTAKTAPNSRRPVSARVVL